jgi:hypothetical protein
MEEKVIVIPRSDENSSKGGRPKCEQTERNVQKIVDAYRRGFTHKMIKGKIKNVSSQYICRVINNCATCHVERLKWYHENQSNGEKHRTKRQYTQNMFKPHIEPQSPQPSSREDQLLEYLFER